jgi:hypothetical protein
MLILPRGKPKQGGAGGGGKAAKAQRLKTHWKDDKQIAFEEVPDEEDIAEAAAAAEAEAAAAAAAAVAASASSPLVPLHPGHGSCTQRLSSSPFDVRAWYHSPYHGAYSRLDKLYVCPFSFRYMRKFSTYAAHCAALQAGAGALPAARRPPGGRRVYLDPTRGVSVWEVDGAEHPLYCQVRRRLARACQCVWRLPGLATLATTTRDSSPARNLD